MTLRWAALALACLALAAPLPAQAARDSSFAATVARLSEPGGAFDTDNLISNESSYLHVMGALAARGVRGGAFLGVGPDQSFSYIAQIEPRVALLVDLRRDNLLQHLLFKALFELSDDRLEYLGLLLARPVPPRPDPAQPIEEIVRYLDGTAWDAARFDAAHARVAARVRGFGVPLDDRDRATVRRFHREFAEAGLGLRFQSHGRPPQSYYPTLRQLILERDGEGRRASYLASDSAWRVVQRLQRSDRVIPVVGDLAGSTALPAIARWLRERGETVSAYYTSNVEYYLAADRTLGAFVENVRRLPHDERSVIIRSVFRMGVPQTVPGYRSTQLLQPVGVLLREYDAGRIRDYRDLVTVGTLPAR